MSSLTSSTPTNWWVLSGLLAITFIVEAIALYSIQKYAKTKQQKFFYYTMAIYGLLVPYMLYKMLTYQGIGMVNFLWNIFSTISGFLIGVFIFSESVNNLQWMGVLLGCVAFALIILGEKSSTNAFK